jgi:NitT/TauT family transport system ATP-binding protein
MPRPRDRKAPRFLEIVDYIYRVLTQPDTQPAPEPGQAAAPSGEPAKQRYPMLPHARPGGVAGLVELLLDRGGRDDIYHLADELAFEIDDLLPIVESSSLLGYITVKEGDAELTPEGRAFAEADILNRKQLFRKTAAERIPLIRQIVRSLESKSDHSMPDEFFRDMLEEHFSEDETNRQLETAINWGRYGELFDHDAASGRFYISEEGNNHE